jgi:hypothetical protein
LKERKKERKKENRREQKVYVYIEVLLFSCIVLHLLAHAISAVVARKRNVVTLPSSSVEDGHGLVDLEHRMDA